MVNYYTDDAQYGLYIFLDSYIKKYLKATEKNYPFFSLLSARALAK